MTLSGEITLTYWYLFAHLSFLMTLPFLRKIARQMTYADMIFLVVLRAFFGALLPILNFWLDRWGMESVVLSEHLQTPFSVINFIYYPLLGYFLANKVPMEKIKGKPIIFCVAGMTAGVMISAWMTYMEGVYGDFSQRFLGCFQFLSAGCLFLIGRYTMEKIYFSPRVAAFLSAAGKITLGIYLFEPIVTEFLYVPFFDLVDWHPIWSTPFSFLWCVLCMGIGGGLTYLLRKIPGVSSFL